MNLIKKHLNYCYSCIYKLLKNQEDIGRIGTTTFPKMLEN